VGLVYRKQDKVEKEICARIDSRSDVAANAAAMMFGLEKFGQDRDGAAVPLQPLSEKHRDQMTTVQI
jgi:hypothetical protein